jgi:hypothetical protein
VAFVLGLVPLGVALLRARGGAGLVVQRSLFASWAGEHTTTGVFASPVAFVRAEPGVIVSALAVAGLALGAFVPRARALLAGVTALAIIGLASPLAGAAAGTTRFGAPVLAGTAALVVLAGIGMQGVVRAVATARVPFAKASATMIVLLELTFPVHAADEALARGIERARGAAATWDGVAWGSLPPGAALLVTDRRPMRRLLAARACGELRGDLAVVPTYALDSPAARRELVREPALVPLWRNLKLSAMPGELALSELAAARPLAVVYEPKWDRPLARHLVADGLAMRFEPEPRGASDRRRALDAFVPNRDRLAKTILATRDPDLVEASVMLLRARTIALAASGDRDIVARAVEDLHTFAPNDPVAAQIVARVVLGKGAVELKDLRP